MDKNSHNYVETQSWQTHIIPRGTLSIWSVPVANSTGCTDEQRVWFDPAVRIVIGHWSFNAINPIGDDQLFRISFMKRQNRQDVGVQFALIAFLYYFPKFESNKNGSCFEMIIIK